ncbi:hypothetical protein BTS2_1070 [Bacillus sp. TS-2]|nr:hypothetical protein BTS2_1070 [Bacillus sp. TS-2]
MIALKINPNRLWESLDKINQFGRNPLYPEKGNTRLSLTIEDLKARQYLINLMKESGLKVKVDPVGNICGRLEGLNSQAPVIMTGSHIDTVVQGGRFDGTLGVLGAIEAVRTIHELGITPLHPIEVVSFTDEEGTRFGTGYIGSRAISGGLDDSVLNLKDDQGISLYEALKLAGYQPDLYKDSMREKSEIKSFVELHIEQGKVLEENDLSVGIVTHIQGPVWLQVSLTGSADHAGATPMYMRKDASLAMAEMMLAVEKAAIEHSGVATVGKLEVLPGGVNIIPGHAQFSVDLRHIDKQKRTEMLKSFKKDMETISRARNVEALLEIKKEVDPAECSTKLIEIISNVCKQSQISTMTLQCGAGHDSLMMNDMTETAMIFVRSQKGISHNPLEYSSLEDCAKGTEVLMNTLLKLAQ